MERRIVERPVFRVKEVKYLVEPDDEDTEYTELWDMRVEGDEDIIMEGDHYHNKVDDRIAGFYEGLGICGYDVVIEEDYWWEK